MTTTKPPLLSVLSRAVALCPTKSRRGFIFSGFEGSSAQRFSVTYSANKLAAVDPRLPSALIRDWARLRQEESRPEQVLLQHARLYCHWLANPHQASLCIRGRNLFAGHRIFETFWVHGGD